MKFRMVKPLYSAIALAFFGIMPIWPMVFIILGGNIKIMATGAVLSALGLVVLCATIERCLFRWILICEEGVAYIRLRKSSFMAWDEIKIVGMGYIPIKAPGRPPWLYFSAHGIPCPMLNARMINDNFFMINYRKEVEDAIRLYWKAAIDGIDS